MADDDKQNTRDDELKNRWKDPVEPAATFAPLEVDTSNPNDYRYWENMPGGWRLLRAAVNGGSALATDEGKAVAKERVNPQSLMDAGAAFERAYLTLRFLAAFMRDHPHAIAGEGKPWQGPAADAFLQRTDYLADFLDAQAQRIAGTPGSGDALSIHQQLYNGANTLEWAAYAVRYLDKAYARLAREAGNAIGDGGLVAITGSPYERPMAQAMADCIDVLAKQYDFLVESVLLPDRGNNLPSPDDSPVPPPPDAPGPPKVPSIPPPNLGGGASNIPSPDVPNVRGPNGSGLKGGVSVPSIPPPATSLPGRSNGGGRVRPPNIPRPNGGTSCRAFRRRQRRSRGGPTASEGSTPRTSPDPSAPVRVRAAAPVSIRRQCRGLRP